MCVSLANNLYTARLQQEGILIGQRCICHSRLCGFVIPRAGICHPDSLPSSFCPSVGGGLFCLYSGIFCPKGWLWGSGALQCHISTACTDRGIGLRICSTLAQIKPGNTMLVSRWEIYSQVPRPTTVWSVREPDQESCDILSNFFGAFLTL